jgi:hypothetical protein
MLNQNLFNVDRIADGLSLRLENNLRPEAVFDFSWLIRCRVKILIVTDSFSGGFNETTGFHLGQIIKILGDDPWSHIQFDVTKAHRESSSEADVIDNFRFDEHDLSQYSQIWLFGISRQGFGPTMSPAELRAVSEFMDAGGGLFATGDHEDLGNQLAAEIPRARSMRRWYYPNPGPNGEPVAPDQTGPNSHDTIVNFGMGGTQTDSEPQQIRPRLYTRKLPIGSFVSQVFRYPHPLLCGPDGVINYLPDHMHEGLCEVPGNLGNSWTFDGQTFVEYPSKDGYQQRPEVVAYATNNHSGDEFGVLAAYDGHRVDVGRVVVDATWHHWFNINTLPYINASDPAHPSYNPATVAKWEEIKAYYRNVAVWLASPSLQRCIRNGGWIRVLGNHDIAMTSRSLEKVKDPLTYYIQLGTLARDALGRGASQCQTVRWILDLLYPLPMKFPFEIDPWVQGNLDESIKELPRRFDFAEFETAVIGAAIHEAREKFSRTRSPQKLLDQDDGSAVEEVLRAGAVRGLEIFSKEIEVSFERTRKMFAQVR